MLFYVSTKRILKLIRRNKLKKTQKFIQRYKREIRRVFYDDKESTLLHFAAEIGNTDFVRFFLKSEIFEVNIQNSCGETPLFVAADKNMFEICVILCKEYAANPFVRCGFGLTPYHTTTSQEIKDYLVDYAKNINGIRIGI